MRVFTKRYGIDIYALSIGNGIELCEYDIFLAFQVNPMSSKCNAQSHIYAQVLGEIVHVCLRKESPEYWAFNAVNNTITPITLTREFLEKAYPNVKVTRAIGEF